jgi:hypothetical protein
MTISRKLVVISAVLIIVAGGGLAYKLFINKPTHKVTSADGTVLEFENSEFGKTGERSPEEIEEANKNLGLTERDGADGSCPNNFSAKLDDGRVICTHGSD